MTVVLTQLFKLLSFFHKYLLFVTRLSLPHHIFITFIHF